MNKIMKFYVFVPLFLFGCVNGIGRHVTEISGNNYALVSPTPAIAAKSESPVVVVGEFSDIKKTGEHCYGYSVSLWKQEDGYLGFLSSRDFSPCGEAPLGLLENVRFDQQSGKITFSARLSRGVSNEKGHDVPTQDIFEFEGVLKKETLSGTLVSVDQLCPDKCRETKKIELRRSADLTAVMEDYKDHSEWSAFAEKILKRLGPKW